MADARPTASTGPRTVCVLGFGRSGTSLTMRILNLLGVHLGAPDDLLAAQAGDNPRGYWEPRWMVDLNDELLAHLGTAWWRPLGAPAGWERSEALEGLRAEARRLLRARLGESPLRGCKDPRLSLTLPFWRDLFEDPLYVICVRNPADAIASLQRRPEPTVSIGDWGRLWLEYTARALRETNGAPREIVFYERYFDGSGAQIERLASRLGVARDDPRVAAAHDEVARNLRHHVTSHDELATLRGIPAPTRTLYMALRAADRLRSQQDDEGPRLLSALERIAPELWWDGHEAVTAIRDRAAAAAHADAVRVELEQARERAATADAETASRERRLAQAEGRIAQLERDRDRLLVELERERTASAALRASWSWRLTAPLRAAKRRARRRPTATGR